MNMQHPAAAIHTRPAGRGVLSFLPLGELSLMLLAFAMLAMAG
jgi:hypothetical protein